ncbi:MAG: SAM-dependent chlorinase/fluorinase [Chloroflexota bacterium]|nr:SAM-dependent chlorinase/fluorinase [Chloroflexota bacterium]
MGINGATVNSIISLTTDFGTDDIYVAAMKGIILTINPQVSIVDICHSIKPQNTTQAAFLINSVYKYFPAGTIHVIVVDPGVGSKRRALLVKSPTHSFIAPDNGILTPILYGTLSSSQHTRSKWAQLPDGFQAFSLTNPQFWHHPISTTFHGRDIFAPIAAHLSLGTKMGSFGEQVKKVRIHPIPVSRTRKNGEQVGHIIHIDHFGNLITNLKHENLTGDTIQIRIAGRQIEKISKCYADEEGLIALIGSSEHLEISIPNGSAARTLGLGIGDIVTLRCT